MITSDKYDAGSLPQSQNYYIDILPNEELGRVCYFAVNKNTNVPEVPFLIAADAKDILSDLEDMIDKPKGVGKVAKLNTIQH